MNQIKNFKKQLHNSLNDKVISIPNSTILLKITELDNRLYLND